MSLDAALRALDKLDGDDLLRFHREVCRRAAKVYEPRYRVIRDRNFAMAMACNDTRFAKGLSVLDNIKRSHALRRTPTLREVPPNPSL